MHTVHTICNAFFCVQHFLILIFRDIYRFSSLTYKCFIVFHCFMSIFCSQTGSPAVSHYLLLWIRLHKKKVLTCTSFCKWESLKGRSWHILGFAGHMISVATIQVCTVLWKQLWKWSGMASVSIKLYRNRQWAEFSMWL